MKEPTRREFLGTLGSAAAALPVMDLAAQGSKRKRPNVILILTDDQAYGDFQCYGNTKLHTPSFDRLYHEGVRFSNFYVQPLCSPTRATIMTGRYCWRGGVMDTWVGVAMMRPNEVTVARLLSEHGGYRTGMFGKWHLGDHYPLRPNDRGFQETLTFESGVIGQTGGPLDNHRINPILLHNGKHVQYHGYCTDIFFDGAMHFIEENRNHPFFVYIPTQSVHAPLECPESFATPFKAMGLSEPLSKIYGMVTNLDQNVGRLLTKLQALGLDKDTVVIFLTDNGMGTPYRYNTGLRGVKGEVYEGGVKTPFFVRWPGRLQAGLDVSRIGAHIDILPTVLDICGVPKPRGLHLDGVSLLPLLEGRESGWPDRSIFLQSCRPDQDGWELPRPYANGAARGQRYKIVMASPHYQNDFPESQTNARSVGMGETELYDIERDPDEKNNIAAGHPEIIFKMRRQYEAWYWDVMKGLDPAVPNLIGSTHENPVLLAPQDMRGAHARFAPWHWDAVHRMAKTEPHGFGYYVLRVAREGRYRFTLSYGPAGKPGIPIIKQGKAFLGIQGNNREKPLAAGVPSVAFEVPLKPGNCRLDALFTGQRSDTQVVSPFLINVEYLG